jgi:hypothetical protein
LGVENNHHVALVSREDCEISIGSQGPESPCFSSGHVLVLIEGILHPVFQKYRIVTVTCQTYSATSSGRELTAFSASLRMFSVDHNTQDTA